MFTFVPYWGFILISSFPSICLPVGLCVSRLYCAVVWASVSVVHIVLSCGPLSSPSVLCTLRANNLSVAVLKGTLSACLYTPDSSIFSCSETWVQRYGVTYTIRLITKACTRQIRLAFFFHSGSTVYDSRDEAHGLLGAVFEYPNSFAIMAICLDT